MCRQNISLKILHVWSGQIRTPDSSTKTFYQKNKKLFEIGVFPLNKLNYFRNVKSSNYMVDGNSVTDLQ